MDFCLKMFNYNNTRSGVLWPTLPRRNSSYRS